MSLALEREAILPRIDGIRKNLKKLKALAGLSLQEFSSDDPYNLAQHHLRLALEGVFHISTHILSRLPGGRAVEYKEIAKKMGEQGIVPKTFANQKMMPMAGMRNILVHFYAGIDEKRFYKIIKDHLVDIEEFLRHIGHLIKTPQKFGLKIR